MGEIAVVLDTLGQPVMMLLIGVGGYHWLTRNSRNGAATAETEFRTNVVTELRRIGTNTDGLPQYMEHGEKAMDRVGALNADLEARQRRGE